MATPAAELPPWLPEPPPVVPVVDVLPPVSELAWALLPCSGSHPGSAAALLGRGKLLERVAGVADITRARDVERP